MIWKILFLFCMLGAGLITAYICIQLEVLRDNKRATNNNRKTGEG